MGGKTCTTSVHRGSANKFLVWIANGEKEKIGSVFTENKSCTIVIMPLNMHKILIIFIPTGSGEGGMILWANGLEFIKLSQSMKKTH